MIDSGLPAVAAEEPSLLRFSLRWLLTITVLISLGLAFVVNLPAMLSGAYRTWQVGVQFDQRVFPGVSFDYRITAFHERGMMLAAPGAFYRYEVKRTSNSNWRIIATFRGSSPDPIANYCLTQVTDACAFFYHEQVYGLTVDGGETWSIKGGPDYPPIVSGRTDIIHIESVEISAEGDGEMRASIYENEEWVPYQGFVTADFGQTWTKE